MNYPGYLKIERSTSECISRVIINRPRNPKFTMEIEVLTLANGHRRKGAIKRVQAPNSVSGSYDSYAKHLSQGERFLEVALEAEAGVASRK